MFGFLEGKTGYMLQLSLCAVGLVCALSMGLGTLMIGCICGGLLTAAVGYYDAVCTEKAELAAANANTIPEGKSDGRGVEGPTRGKSMSIDPPGPTPPVACGSSPQKQR